MSYKAGYLPQWSVKERMVMMIRETKGKEFAKRMPETRKLERNNLLVIIQI